MNNTIIAMADSYKYSHWMQYPKGTENNNSYIEARGIDRDAKIPKNTQVVFFGLQMFIKEYLSDPITLEDIDEAERMITAHGMPFNRDGWEMIVNEFGGYLPIEIVAV